MTPMTLLERLLAIGGCIAGLGYILSLLSKKKLTFPFALLWIAGLGLAGLGFAILPLVVTLCERLALGRDVYDLGFVVAAGALVGVLLYLSVRISVLTHRFEELAQRVGLIEFGLDERISARDRSDHER